MELRSSLRYLVGDMHEERLAMRAKGLLLAAYSASGTALGPHTIYVHTDDDLAIAASRVLCACGFLKQDDTQHSSGDVYAFFAITAEGAELAKKLVMDLSRR